MFKYIPGNHKYKISLEGKIVKSNGEECDLPILNNCVQIELYNKPYQLDLTWLALYAHYEIVLPENMFDQVFNISFVETTPLAKLICNKVMVFKTPLLINKKYRIIPRFTDYAISFKGEVIEVATGDPVIIKKRSENSDGYHYVNIYDPDRCYFRTIALHRLVALAWVRNTEPEVKCVVNHLDGIKTNNHPYNLEWTTYSGNAIHAIENGLREDNVKCKVLDVVTKEIKEFVSLGSACKYMKCGTPDINSLNFKRKGKTINNRYEFKFDSDASPWFYLDKDSVINPGRYVVTVKYPDGVVEDFYDLRDVKSKLHVWNVSNVHQLVSKAKVMYPDYVISFIDHYDSRMVQGYEIATGNIVETKTIMAMAEIAKIPKGKIRNSIIAGETRNTEGWAFRYKVDTPWDTNFTEFYGKAVRIQATNINTEEVLIFNSLRSIAKHFKIDRSVVKLCLESGKLYKDWEIKEI